MFETYIKMTSFGVKWPKNCWSAVKETTNQPTDLRSSPWKIPEDILKKSDRSTENQDDIDKMGVSKAQLDYIFLKKMFISSNLNCESCSPLERVSADHAIISAKIRLNLCRSK